MSLFCSPEPSNYAFTSALPLFCKCSPCPKYIFCFFFSLRSFYGSFPPHFAFWCSSFLHSRCVFDFPYFADGRHWWRRLHLSKISVRTTTQKRQPLLLYTSQSKHLATSRQKPLTRGCNWLRRGHSRTPSRSMSMSLLPPTISSKTVRLYLANWCRCHPLYLLTYLHAHYLLRFRCFSLICFRGSANFVHQVWSANKVLKRDLSFLY